MLEVEDCNCQLKLKKKGDKDRTLACLHAVLYTQVRTVTLEYGNYQN